MHTWIHEYTGEENRSKGNQKDEKGKESDRDRESEETCWDSVLTKIKGLRPTRTWSNVYIKGGRM